MALTQANDILNGYFYTFIYKAKDGSLEVDETPVIYCIGPAPGRDNNIIGLNFHKLPEVLRETLVAGMHKRKRLLDSNSRTIFSEMELNSILPGAKACLREYNRKRIYYPLRIDNKDLIYYIYGDGKQRIDRKPGMQEFVMNRWKSILNK